MSVPLERSVRVSTLELFFDLVFVFTITQLTGLLVEGLDAKAVLRVVVMLLLIWWMYDGYAWLTNAIATDRLRFRLLLIGGMGGFLVMALGIPDAYDGEGIAFGIGLVVVVVLHAAMYVRGTSVSEVRAILRIVPFNLVAVGLVLAGGALGGAAQQALWALAAGLLWVSPWLTTVEGFVVSVAHFVERHGLVVIIALGESIVAIGAAAAELELDAGVAFVALVSLGLSAALWWVYFSDEETVEAAMSATSPEGRPRLALVGFGYWHYGIILAIVAVAAGLEKAIEHPYEPSDAWTAVALAVGVGGFITCEVGFRRTFGITRSQIRLVAALAVLATIPLGTESSALAQVSALTAVVAAALTAEGWWDPLVGHGWGRRRPQPASSIDGSGRDVGQRSPEAMGPGGARPRPQVPDMEPMTSPSGAGT
jgi:low temperature requirement protein LtrA